MADAAIDHDFIPDPQQASDPDFVPDQKKPDTAAMKSYVQKNIDEHFHPGETEASKEASTDKKVNAHKAEGFYDALIAGYQGSATGLAIRGELPTEVMPEDASTAVKIAGQIGGLADLPMMAAAGLVGARANPKLALPTAFAVPATVRKILIDHYEKGDILTKEDFASRFMSTSWEAIKGATTGAVTAYTGGVAGKFAGPIAQKITEVAAMTTTAAALEGQLPDVSDFLAGAVVVGGLHGVGVIRPKLANMYAITGEKPGEIALRSQNDVQLKQSLIAGNLNEPMPPAKIGENNELKSIPIKAEDLQPKSDGETRKNLPELTPEEKDTLSKIGVQGEATDSTLKEKWQGLYARKIDKNAPLKYAIQEAEARGAKIAPEDNAQQSAARFAAHQDAIASFYEHGTRDFETGKVNGEGLNKIYADIPDRDMERFRAYAMNERALELHGRDITPWKDFNPEAAQKVVDAGKDLYGDINQRRIDFKNRVLEYVRKSGLIDEAGEARMVEANKKSFPFHRVQEPDVFTGKTGSGSILQKIYGSDKLILDPVLSDYQDTALMIKKAMINDVRNKFLENMKAGNLVDEGGKGSTPNLDAYLKRVPDKVSATVIGSDELSAALKKQDINLKPDDITIFRSESETLKPNQVAFKIDGKRVIYEGPQGVIDSLKILDGDKAAMDMWTKFMGGFTKVERIGVTSDPTFGLRHFFRAGVMSGVYTKTGQIPFYHAAGVIGDIVGKTDLYRDAQYYGAFSKVFEPINDQFMKKNIEAAGIETNFVSKAWNVVKHPLEASEAWIKLTDSASRLSEFKRAREQGKTPEEAAYLARNVVVDYQKVGLERMAIRQTAAFIGVHINSMDQLRLAFVEDPKSTIARLAMVSSVSAALWAVNNVSQKEDGSWGIVPDEAIDATADWQKNLTWQINISRGAAAAKGEKYDPKTANILRLPKPWAAGILFGGGTEVALDTYFKNNPQELGHFAKSLFSSIVPVAIPNMISPIIEQSFNQSITTGRPIVSVDKQRLLPELRYDNYTSETAKQIGSLIGYVPGVRDLGPSKDPLASPAVVDHYIRSWTGTMGGLVLKVLDTGLRAAGVGNQHTQPEGVIAESVFFNSFISRYPSMKNQNLQDFYTNKDKLDLNLNSLKFSAKQGDIDEFNKIVQEHGDQLYKLDGIGKGISNAKKALDMVQFKSDIKPVEKRQIMDTLIYQIGSMAKMGNQIVVDLEKQKNKSK